MSKSIAAFMVFSTLGIFMTLMGCSKSHHRGNVKALSHNGDVGSRSGNEGKRETLGRDSSNSLLIFKRPSIERQSVAFLSEGAEKTIEDLKVFPKPYFIGYTSSINQMASTAYGRLLEFRGQPSGHEPSSFRKTPECVSPDSCPWSEGVGLIGMIGGDCTATLVARDVLVTAGHCVHGIKPGERVNGTFSLPEIKKGSRTISFERLQLGRLVGKTLETYKDVDFAFIHLSTPAQYHSPVKISREGFRDGETYKTIGVDRLPTKTMGMWRIVETCYSSYNNIFSPYYDHKFDPTVSLGNCPIGDGNSGAPVLNSRGELVGVISGHINPSIHHVVSTYLDFHGFRNDGDLSITSMASNFACIPDVLGGQPVVGNDCEQSGASDLTIDVEVESVKQELEGKLSTLVDQGTFRKSNIPFLGFRTTYVWTPDCIHESQFADLHRLKSGSQRRELPSVLYSSVIDDTYNITGAISDPYYTNLWIKESSNGESDFYEVSAPVFSHQIVYKGRIPKCTP